MGKNFLRTEKPVMDSCLWDMTPFLEGALARRGWWCFLGGRQGWRASLLIPGLSGEPGELVRDLCPGPNAVRGCV